MSETNVRSGCVSEKQILTEFLKLYRTFPCLWDQKHILYCNREARDRAYDALLEKYKLYQENATQADVKKKIENMRCAYRRDHKKVLMSQFRGQNYKPHLWYYSLLTFLNENSEHDNDQDTSKFDVSTVSQCDNSYQDYQELEDSEEETKPKKRKKQSNRSSNTNTTIYLTEELNTEKDEDVRQDLQYEIEPPQSYIVSNESEAFGRTVGFQLKELSHMQRIFAEKIISDVIFQARLGRLTAETSLSDE